VRYLDRIINPDDTPLAWLTEHLTDAEQFHATVGYLDRAGIRLVEARLRDLLERGGQAHVVVDYRDGSPRYGDIAWLVDMFAPYGQRATLRLVSDQDRLHSKTFAIYKADSVRTALVGSANLTAAGLSRNWEACIVVDPDDTATLDSVFAAATAWRASPAGAVVDLGKLAALAILNAVAGGTEMLADLLLPALNEIEAAGTPTGPTAGIPTGFTDLDRLLGGLRPGNLVLVAGRTSMGKTTLAMDFLRTAAVRHGLPSLLLSFEMTKSEITQRILSAESRIPLHVLRSGQLTDDDWSKLTNRMGEIDEAPLHVSDSCPASIRPICEEIRRAVGEDEVRMVVVDYIQQLTADRRTENRQQEITEIARSFKRLALELGIPIVVVSQLNRGPEMRTDKRPLLSDLRDSGTLEEAADVVVLLHRDDYYDKESPRAGEADLIVAKHRNGPTDTVTVAAQLHLTRFVDMFVG
jgi:KaiC/GvpD/RAD55 family RecA-like ATPase/HKD family nuclease